MCHLHTHKLNPDQSKHSLLSVGGRRPSGNVFFCPPAASIPELSPGFGGEGPFRRIEAVFHLCLRSEGRQPQQDQRPGITLKKSRGL